MFVKKNNKREIKSYCIYRKWLWIDEVYPRLFLSLYDDILAVAIIISIHHHTVIILLIDATIIIIDEFS